MTGILTATRQYSSIKDQASEHTLGDLVGPSSLDSPSDYSQSCTDEESKHQILVQSTGPIYPLWPDDTE